MCQSVSSSGKVSLGVPRSQCLLSITLSVVLYPLTQIPAAAFCLQIRLKGLQSNKFCNNKAFAGRFSPSLGPLVTLPKASGPV